MADERRWILRHALHGHELEEPDRPIVSIGPPIPSQQVVEVVPIDLLEKVEGERDQAVEGCTRMQEEREAARACEAEAVEELRRVTAERDRLREFCRARFNIANDRITLNADAFAAGEREAFRCLLAALGEDR